MSDPLQDVVAKVYEDLRELARRMMGDQRSDHTLQATALVNEAFIRLARSEGAPTSERASFVALAARTMRSILVDHARRKGAAKRGGDWGRVTVSGQATPPAPDLELTALDQALERLAEIDPRKAKVVELRYFAGLSVEATAHVLDSSPATIKRDWALARAWLHREILPGK